MNRPPEHPTIRPPAVAGTFYPAESQTLDREVRRHLSAARPVEPGFGLRILIVPHAGYVYSGPVAATGYRLVEAGAKPRRIVLVGPSHYAAFRGLVLPGADLLATPLGSVPVDRSAADEAASHPHVAVSAFAHEREHSLEVQLPFLQVVAPGVPVVPFLTGEIEPIETAEVVEPLLDDGTLLVVSSDLSHYHDAGTARRRDAATIAAIERLDSDALGREAACGRTGIRAALVIARRRGYAVEVLDVRNSGDTAGPPDRVVGYASVAIGGGTGRRRAE